MTEQWKPVVGYEGLYEVSNLGRVKSIDRVIERRNNSTMNRGGMILTQNKKHAPSGRLCAMTVGVSKGGKARRRPVHRFVLEAFVGPCPKGMECCHNDGDPTNNHVDNLRWDTRKANAEDGVRHGTSNRGIRSPCALLSEEQVVEIAKMIRQGDRQVDIAARYGVSNKVIWAIAHGQNWSWLTGL